MGGQCFSSQEEALEAAASALMSFRSPERTINTRLQPYLELIRFEKPTGTILMFWPFAWGLTMAAYSIKLSYMQYTYNLAWCIAGAFIMRCSACTVNDIFDREIDACVERTRNRPLPSKRISVFAAIVYLLVQYALGTFFFFLTLKGTAFWVAVFQLLPLFFIYPLLKRITHWPQAWLGFAMNFGYISAWVAMTGHLNWPLLAVGMAGCWCWTMMYDTIYACQDIKDDVKTGVRSTAILFGSWIHPLLMMCGGTFVLMLGFAGYINGQGLAYFLLSVGGAAAHMAWQFATVDLDNPDSCWRNFNGNGQLGCIIWVGLLVDYVGAIQGSTWRL